MMKKIRLDQLVFDLGLTESRAPERPSVLAGTATQTTVHGKKNSPSLSLTAVILHLSLKMA